MSGIDVVAISSHPGHLLVFDCEGGNNAMSKSHSIVTVARASTLHLVCDKKGKAGKYKQHEAAWVLEPYGFLAVCSRLFEVGALFATALVFVTDGKASEAAIEALARMLEDRERLNHTRSRPEVPIDMQLVQSVMNCQERSLIKCDGTGSLQATYIAKWAQWALNLHKCVDSFFAALLGADTSLRCESEQARGYCIVPRWRHSNIVLDSTLFWLQKGQVQSNFRLCKAEIRRRCTRKNLVRRPWRRAEGQSMHVHAQYRTVTPVHLSSGQDLLCPLQEVRSLISKAYPENQRHFFTVPVDNKSEFEELLRPSFDKFCSTLLLLQACSLCHIMSQNVKTRGEVGEVAWSHSNSSPTAEDGETVDDRCTGSHGRRRWVKSQFGFSFLTWTCRDWK